MLHILHGFLVIPLITYITKWQVNNVINCGIYVFTPKIFSIIEEVYHRKGDRGNSAQFLIHNFLCMRLYVAILTFQFWYVDCSWCRPCIYLWGLPVNEKVQSNLLVCLCIFNNEIFSYNFFTVLIKFSSRSIPTGFVRLDEDILSPLAGKKELYAYETNDFWQQIKTPG